MKLARSFALSALAACALPTCAQTTSSAAPDPLAEVHAASKVNAYWPESLHDGKFIVVTLADPGKRHSCVVQESTADTLTCKGSKGAAPTIYHCAEVAALILPAMPHHHWWPLYAADISLEAGFIYGAILLNPISISGSVLVAEVGSAVALFFTAVTAFSAEDAPAHQSEQLVFLQPGTQLSVKLRK